MQTDLKKDGKKGQKHLTESSSAFQRTFETTSTF